MLFSRWTDILQKYSDQTAVFILASQQAWTFQALNDEVEKLPTLAPGAFHSASISQGLVPFLVETLRAWRDHAVFCPMEKEDTTWPFSTCFPKGIAHLKLTSGSTGQSKCVMMTAEQIAADADHILASMTLDRRFPNLAVISAAHSYGFSNLVTPLLLFGHPVVASEDALPASLRKAFELPHRYTLPAVPAMWQAWHRLGILRNAPIELAISAGAPLSIDLEREIFEQAQLKVHNFYGSSECGGIAFDASSNPRIDPTFVGKRLHRVALSLHEDGCLVVSGPAVAEGYHDAPAEDPTSLSSGQFITSDLVRLEEDRVYLLGRISDAINIAGRKLNPQDVELAISKYPGVKHVVTFGIPSHDPARCEECVAIIHPENEFMETGLQAHLGHHLAMWQKPRHLWVTETLLPDLRGKMSRKLWKSRYLEHISS